jgi:hypothetical protein
MPHRTRHRIRTVILAPIATLAAWALTQLIGIDLVVSTRRRCRRTRRRRDGRAAWPCSPLGSSCGCSNAAAGNHSGHGRSPAPPFSRSRPSVLPGSRTAASAVALIFLHIVTAVVVITGFARTLPARATERIERRRSQPSRDPAR